MITLEYLNKYEKDIKNYDYEIKRITREINIENRNATVDSVSGSSSTYPYIARHFEINGRNEKRINKLEKRKKNLEKYKIKLLTTIKEISLLEDFRNKHVEKQYNKCLKRVEAIETVLQALENSISKNKIKESGYHPTGPETSDGIRTPNSGSNVKSPELLPSKIYYEIDRIATNSPYSFSDTINYTINFLSKIDNTQQLIDLYEVIKVGGKH